MQFRSGFKTLLFRRFNMTRRPAQGSGVPSGPTDPQGITSTGILPPQGVSLGPTATVGPRTKVVDHTDGAPGERGIVVQRDGNDRPIIFVGYHDTGGVAQTRAFVSADGGQSFNRGSANHDFDIIDPHGLRIDSQNRCHVAGREPSNLRGHYERFTIADDGTVTFSEQDVVFEGETTYETSVGMRTDDIVAILYVRQDSVTGSKPVRLYVTDRVDGTFRGPFLLSEGTNETLNPDLRIDSTNIYHIVYSDATTDERKYIQWDPTSTSVLVDNEVIHSHPDLTATDEGNYHNFCLDGDENPVVCDDYNNQLHRRVEGNWETVSYSDPKNITLFADNLWILSPTNSSAVYDTGQFTDLDGGGVGSGDEMVVADESLDVDSTMIRYQGTQMVQTPVLDITYWTDDPSNGGSLYYTNLQIDS